MNLVEEVTESVHKQKKYLQLIDFMIDKLPDIRIKMMEDLDTITNLKFELTKKEKENEINIHK